MTALHGYSFSKNFEDRELHELAKLFTRKTYKAGEFIIIDNASTEEVFFLEKGSVEILRTIHGKEYSLRSLSTKNFFGELAYLTSQKRLGNVKAKDDVEVLVMKKEDFAQLPPEFKYLQYKLSLHMAADRLRDNYQQIADEMILRNKFGKFVIAIILGFCLFISFLTFHEQLLAYTSYYTIGAITFVFGAMLCLYIIKHLQQPIRSFGLTLDNWQRSLVEAFVICTILVLASLLIWPNAHFFDGVYRGSYLTLYIFVSFIQEFIFRGVTLTAFEKFYDSAGYAILITSFLFGILHIHSGLIISTFSFIMGLFLGWLYVRHQNLLGITIVHVCIGNLATITGIMQQY